MFLSKYGVARHITVPVVKRGVTDFAVGADWTPATGDVKISKDGGTAANVTNLPTAIAMGNGAIWDFSLTATEMQAAQIVVTVSDSATKAVEDQSFIIETYGNASAQHAVDLDDGVRAGLTALPNAAADTAGGLPISDAGGLDLDAQKTAVDGIKAKADSLPADPADASDIAGAFSTVNATLATIASYVDTEVAAIKAKTDNLPASPAATGDAMTLTTAYDFAKGTAAMTEAYAANGVAPTPVQALFAIHQILMAFTITGTTNSVKKLDGSTEAFAVTLDDDTAPTAASRA